jgi:cobalt-zinc-cadmium efflux system outer membrane protein
MLVISPRFAAWAVSISLLWGYSMQVVAQPSNEPSDKKVSDTLLHEFVSDIVARQPELAAASAAIDVAEAKERSADRPRYNPELKFDAQDAVDKTVQIGVAQTIDWSGKKKAAYEVSGARRLSAEAEYHVVRDQLAGRILVLLSGYWSAIEFGRLASSSSDLMHDFAQQAKIRYDAGDMTQVEYETSVLAYAEVRIRHADATGNLAEVIRKLTALGAPEKVQTWPSMPETLPALTIKPGEIDPFIASLPEVKAATALVKVAAADVELTKRLKKPDPTIGLRVGEEDDERLIGFSFSIPLHVRNSFSEEVLASIASRSQAEAGAAAIEQEARADLLVAMERYSIKRAAWSVWEEVGASSIERRAEALRKLWDAREIDMSSFLLQVRQTLETRSTVMELRASLFNSWIEYLIASDKLDGWLRGEYAMPEKPGERITMRNN